MNLLLDISVPARPVPEGSMVAFLHKLTKRAMCKPSNEVRLKEWRKLVGDIAAINWRKPPYSGDVAIEVYFAYERPKKHFTGNRLNDNSPLSPTNSRYADVDKLQRAIGDALQQNARMLANDSQIVTWQATKVFAPREGVRVLVWALDEPPYAPPIFP